MVKCLYSAILLACFQFFTSCAWSQHFIDRHYGLQDGLASPTIHSIFQDKDGFIWFGTESGLCRYDGNRFKTFTVKDGLPGNEVFGMFQDSKGRIWLEQYKNSVTYILNGKIYTRENDSLLKQIKLTTRIFGIAEDGQGNIGLCDNNALFIIPPTGKTIKTIHSAEERALHAIGLYADRNRQFVLCNHNMLYKVEDGRLKPIMALFGKNLTRGPTEVLLHAQYVVIGHPNRYLTVYMQDTTLHTRLPAGYTLKYSAVSDSVLSINTGDGAFLFNTHTYRMIKIMPGKKVTNTLMDREKNLWIGTSSEGIYKISSWEIVNNKIKNNANDIYYISKIAGRIVVGNNNEELYEYNKDRFTKINIPSGRPPNIHKIFYYEKQGGHSAFLAHSMGIMRYENDKLKESLYTLMIKQVSPVDKAYLLMAAHTGLHIVRKNNFSHADTIWNRASLSALKVNDSIFAGTVAGLFILKKSSRRYIIVDSLLQSSIISFIKKSDNNLVWVCTYEDGLYCLKNGKIIRHFSDTSGLPGNNGRSLFVSHNTIWMGTDKGLVKLTAGEDGFHLQTYSISDGLASNIINSIYAENDTIYVGTPEGLCHFNESMIETSSICNLVLTGVRIGDSMVDCRNRYTLRNGQRFTVEFSGISFRSEQVMSYRYRIKGLTDTWQRTNQNVLEFASLPYGRYTLEIIATNKFRKESRPLEIELQVIKPFYKKNWFILLAIALPCFTALLLYNYRANQEKKNQLQKLQQEVKMLELEQSALREQMNPHFIFNCINVIQQLVTEGDTDNTNKFISGFANLVRQALDNAPKLFVPLTDEITFLSNYFELERIKLEDRFSYIIDATGIQNTASWRVPNMVIQPFVENAIRHGIRYKKDGKGLINMVFEQQGPLLRCTITDNGIGREKAGQLRKASGADHVSKGMSITFKRIESLNALTPEKICVEIEDLKNGQLEAAGTRVIIDFYKTGTRHDTNGYYRR